MDYASLVSRRDALLSQAKEKIMLDIRTGNQSTVKHPIEWPWVVYGTATEYQMTGQVFKYRVPTDGLYLIGANGASGATVRHLFKRDARRGNAFVQNKGGRGARLCCLLSLKKGTHLAILVGEEGQPYYTGTSGAGGDRLVSGGVSNVFNNKLVITDPWNPSL